MLMLLPMLMEKGDSFRTQIDSTLCPLNIYLFKQLLSYLEAATWYFDSVVASISPQLLPKTDRARVLWPH